MSEVSIYTLSDLGDLSNLIGSLSRTIQQYSPPSEWIMCELGVFPISVNSGFGNIYLAAFAARQIFSHYSPRFQRIIVNYFCGIMLLGALKEKCISRRTIRFGKTLATARRLVFRSIKITKVSKALPQESPLTTSKSH